MIFFMQLLYLNSYNMHMLHIHAPVEVFHALIYIFFIISLVASYKDESQIMTK